MFIHLFFFLNQFIQLKLRNFQMNVLQIVTFMLYFQNKTKYIAILWNCFLLISLSLVDHFNNKLTNSIAYLS